MAFSEMSLSAVAPEDVPATYFLRVRVSELRQSIGRLRQRGCLVAPYGRLSEKGTLHKAIFCGAKNF